MSKSSTTTGDDPMGLAQMRRTPTHPGAVLVEHLRSADTTQPKRRVDWASTACN